ncbi:hypothetical protein O3P69_001775 [Scylla paramamosain]|uniref:Uncharacterized protein n=1 Tax=Scylla paramamosain TaxID=85552 RepID=A0AAW0UZC9_SCYPA
MLSLVPYSTADMKSNHWVSIKISLGLMGTYNPLREVLSGPSASGASNYFAVSLSNLKINVNIKKKNLELLKAKKKGGDVAGLGVDGGNNDLLLQTMDGAGGGTGGCGSGDDAKKDDMEDKFNKIKQKIKDEDAHIKSMLHTVLSSRRVRRTLSESNNDRSAVPSLLGSRLWKSF